MEGSNFNSLSLRLRRKVYRMQPDGRVHCRVKAVVRPLPLRTSGDKLYLYIKDTGREKREWIPDVSQRESVEWIPQEDNRDNRRRNSFPAKKSDHVRRNNDRLART
ncbi:hypothetical protein PV326_005317 [Microctonus aethiopoides]|nr:hypothetical protein PV326_005317 [Microctonus aethiopoides]